MAKTFILSDESLNCYGFKVLTEGIDISQFSKNPVLLFNHIDWGHTSGTYNGPIGRWENIRKENGQLLADAVFDENDPTAKLIADKVANDFIRAASLGFQILATDETPENMSMGQTRATVTKCKALEASVVDFPGNENALCLYDENSKKIDLKDSQNFEKVNLSLINHNKPLEPMKLKLSSAWTALSLFFALSFTEKETEKEFEFTPEKLKALNDELALLSATKTELATAKTDLEKLRGEKTEADNKLKDSETAKTAIEAKYNELKAANDGQGSDPTKLKSDKQGNTELSALELEHVQEMKAKLDK